MTHRKGENFKYTNLLRKQDGRGVVKTQVSKHMTQGWGSKHLFFPRADKGKGDEEQGERDNPRR